MALVVTAFALQAQTLPPGDGLSDAVGTVAGSFRVDESGQASYQIPIATTPGTAGMSPQLALVYSSQGGPSAVGQGWQLAGQSQIARCRATREAGDSLAPGMSVAPPVSFSAADVFCLDGQRLLLTSGQYGAAGSEYRPENDPFTRVFAAGGNNSASPALYTGPDSFVVLRRDGTRTEYGATDEARLRITGCGPGQPRACAAMGWAINRVEDSSGNFITFHYSKWLDGAFAQASGSADEQHLSEVRYTGKRQLPGQSAPASEPYARVVFAYSPLPQARRVRGFTGGVPYAQTRLLTGVSVRESVGSAPATDVRHYALEHAEAASGSGAQLVTRIRECTNSTRELCLQATQFEYDPRSHALTVSREQSMSGSQLGERLDVRLADVDGDGRQDLVWLIRNVSGCSGRPGVRVAFAQHTGSGASSLPGFNTSSTAVFCLQRGEQDIENGWHLFDYDGDGRDDLFIAGAPGFGGGTLSQSWRVHRSLGRPSSAAQAVFSAADSLGVDESIRTPNSLPQAQLMDVNGDGLVDVLYPISAGSDAFASTLAIRLTEVDAASGTRGFGPERPVVFEFGLQERCGGGGSAPTGFAFEQCVLTFGRANSSLVGVESDGDGAADLLLQSMVIYTSGPLPVQPSRVPVLVSPQEFDALARARESGREVSQHWHLFSSRGQTVQGQWRMRSVPLGDVPSNQAFFPTGDDLPAQRNRMYLADVNGDGLADLVYAPYEQTDRVRVRLNTGAGFAASSAAFTGIPDVERIQLVDIDGDGRADLLHPPRSNAPFFQCGSQNVDANTRPLCLRRSGFLGGLFGDAEALTDLHAAADDGDITKYDQLFGDFDGDGQLDYLRFARGQRSQHSELRIVRRPARHAPVDTLTAIVDGFGARTDIHYQPMTNRAVYRRGRESWKLAIGRGSPVFDLLAPMYLVARVDSSAPQFGQPAAVASTRYRYAEARMQSGGRGFLGFGSIDSFDLNTASTQGYGLTRTEYFKGFPATGHPFQTTRVLVRTGAAAPAQGVDAACLQDPEGHPSCLEPVATAWGPVQDIANAELHSLAVNVLRLDQPLQAVPSCWFPDPASASALLQPAARTAQGSPLLPRFVTLPAAVSPLHLYVAGSAEAGYAIDTQVPAPGSAPQQLNQRFTAHCAGTAYGDIVRSVVDERDPASDFNLSLLVTDTRSSYTQRVSNAGTHSDWLLGRLTQSGVQKTLRPGRTNEQTETRTASFEYELQTTRKSGLLQRELAQGSAGPALRTLHDLDDYGNRVATWVCSDLNPDGSARTDAQCRDASRVRHQLTDASGAPTISVHRYTRTQYDTIGRYPVRTRVPYFNGATSGNDVIERTSSEVISRDVFGNPTEVRDANGRRSYARFGALGRPFASAVEGGATEVLRLRLCSAVSCPTDAVYRMETSRSDGPTRWSYHDRLGHTVLSVQQGFEAGVSGRDLVATCSYRDVRGQPERSSVPFFLPGVAVAGAPSFAAQPAPCAQPQSWELTDYDLLGRPEQVLAPDQSALVFSYAGLRTEQTQVMPTPSGPQHFSRWETRNVLGQVVSERQSQDGQGTAMGMEVQHTYDAQGQLRTTRRDAGRGEIVTEQIYDALGRMVERRDPDRGREQFVYNAAGELIRRVDANGWQTRLFYDAQGRLWKRESVSLRPRQSSGGASLFADGFEGAELGMLGQQTERWVYDTASNGIGQLHFDERVADQEASYRRTYAYDSLGRPTTLSTLIEGRTRSESTEYDALGRPSRVTDATGQVLEQTFTPRGYAWQLRNGLQPSELYNEILSLNARGQVTAERRGGSDLLRIQREFDPVRGWLTRLRAGNGDQLQNLEYGWDPLGRMSFRRDHRTGAAQQEVYVYDALHRLTSWQVQLGNTWLTATTLAYDDLGNLCRKGTRDYRYQGRAGCALAAGLADASPHAVSEFGGRQIGYDSQGRMRFRAGATAGSDRHTGFNGLDQLVLATVGSQQTYPPTLFLSYAPDGSRYLRRETINGQATVTRTFGSVEEVTRPDGVVEDRRQLGVLIETRYSNGTAPLKQYLFTDALGSVDVIASATGAVLQRMSFDPHGARRNANDWNSAAAFVIPPYTTRGFTGHEQLDSVGLIHMGGRVYDPELGRFLQPDPMLDAGLQGLNRYSYVLNNPLALTDPSGYLSLGQLLRTVVAVAITVYTGGWAGGLWGATLSTGQAFAVTVAGGFAAGAVQSGTLKGGLYGAFSGALFFGIGSYFDAGTQASAWARSGDKLNTIGRVSKVVAHGSAGGITSSLQGGKFAHGFASAGFSEAAGPLTQGIESQAARGVVHAMIGGTASSLSGGKFANGAVTAAMSYAMGSMAQARADRLARESSQEAFTPRKGNTATGRYGLFPEYADDPVMMAVYELGVEGNRRSADGREYHAFGGFDAEGDLVFQSLQRGRDARITTELLRNMAGEFNAAYPGGSIQYSFHTHGNDVGRPGAFENFSPSDRSFYRQNPIVGRVTGFVATPRGLLLMYNPATGQAVQIGRVPAVPRRPGR